MRVFFARFLSVRLRRIPLALRRPFCYRHHLPRDRRSARRELRFWLVDIPTYAYPSQHLMVPARSAQIKLSCQNKLMPKDALLQQRAELLPTPTQSFWIADALPY
jgi:hypothetical protein